MKVYEYVCVATNSLSLRKCMMYDKWCGMMIEI